ncbi:hypothetical protein [Acidipropionibacterium acidipropionici]|uniref:hypothetical protein n=1 Tax=Acidipropionibacterium acidipropionici TaxID=1748 RepID=UPI00110C0692|nr:hypothetical protein [Acidipropionibacterium acidipropionici]QCV95808.1 hypothetical protein FEZ30_11550 [Acidipropionibacterium acidipropionici]
MISARTLRNRAATAVVAVTLLAPVLAGCSQEPKVIRAYTPAAGVNTGNDSVKLRDLALVHADGQARLSGMAASSQNDAITGVTGQAMSSDDSVAGPLGPSTTHVALTANEGKNLATAGIQVSSDDLKDGLLASITITFANSDPVTVLTPVISAGNPDFTPAAPTPSSTPSAPSSTPSALSSGSPAPTSTPSS